MPFFSPFLSMKRPDLRAEPRVVRGYSPAVLLRAGVRRLTAMAAGGGTDMRLLQAALDRAREIDVLTRYDYTPEGPAPLSLDTTSAQAEGGHFWVDYMANTGNGFEATYAMACLLGEPALFGPGHDTGQADGAHVDTVQGLGVGATLPAGQLLLLGGGQIHPDPLQPEGYETRLVRPFALAGPCAAPDRRLFALPGECDWQDGLQAFDRLFCAARDRADSPRVGRQVGRYQCPQYRSYFALRLPHNWWIWGPDILPEREVDEAQISYFREVARLMGPDDKVVLCLARPGWLEAGAREDEAAGSGTIGGAYGNMVRVIELFRRQDARLCAVIASGGLHYARYKSDRLNLNLITSGGGGAGLHPTHHLPDEIDIDWHYRKSGEELPRTARLNFSLLRRRLPNELDGKPEKSIEPACYPARKRSRRLAWRCLLFPFLNWRFSLGLGLAYLLFFWLFSHVALVDPSPPGGGERHSVHVQQLMHALSDHVQALWSSGGETASRAGNAADAQGALAAYLDDVVPAPTSLLSLPAVMSAFLVQAVVNSPPFAVLLLAILAGLYKFAGGRGVDGEQRRLLRLVVAIGHFAAHITAVLGLSFLFVFLNQTFLREIVAAFMVQLDALWGQIGALLGGLSWSEGGGDAFLWPYLARKLTADVWLGLLYPLEFILVGGLVAGLVFGLYLFVSSRFLGLHGEGAFAATGPHGYTHFLRLCFTPNRLLIYPIALDHVPSRGGWRMNAAWQAWFRKPTGERPTVPVFEPRRALSPRLVEGPVEIDARYVINVPR